MVSQGLHFTHGMHLLEALAAGRGTFGYLEVFPGLRADHPHSSDENLHSYLIAPAASEIHFFPCSLDIDLQDTVGSVRCDSMKRDDFPKYGN